MPLSKKRDRERKRLFRLENKKIQPKSLYPVQPNDMKSKLAAQGIGLDGNRILGLTSKDVQPKETIPIYNPAMHKAGDRVLVRPPYSKKLIEVTIPEVDMDGNAIPDY